ncbi:MAG: YicC/YloC family endoribonuclease [Chthoniobacterales bacterium]
MTGFGRGEEKAGKVRYLVECTSVNRKQADIAVMLPRELASLETLVRETMAETVSRGRINVMVSYETAKNSASVVDEEAAERAYASMLRLKKRLKLTGEITLDTVLKAPGVISSSTSSLSPKEAWVGILPALKTAIAQLKQMRAREGEHLKRELEKRMKKIQRFSKQMEDRAPHVTTRYREALHKRLQDSGLPLPLNDDRLMKEIAIFAERSDISEELCRIASHLKQFSEKIAATEPVGKSLEFITQEIFRELNTIGAKANDVETSRIAVESKSELEKIREQLSNIE